METTPLFAALAAGAVVSLMSLVGLITFIPQLKVIIEKRLSLLSSFSAGVFLIIGILLLGEIFEGGIDLFLILPVVLGALVTFALTLIPEYHHHHLEEKSAHKHSRKSALRILVGDGFHNMGDGVLIGTAFLINIQLGVITTIGIIIHELLQELSKFFLLRQSGYSTRQAIFWSIVVSSTVFFGILLSFIAADLEKILLGFAAGSILTVVIHDLVPSVIQNSKQEEKQISHILAFLTGVILILILSFFFHH